MTKKRDRIRRRREVARARKGTRRSSEKTGRPPVAKVDDRANSKDLWLAVGVVLVIVALFVGLYYFTVRRPSQKAQEVTEVAATNTPERIEMSWSEPPTMTIDTNKDYEAVISTEKGDIRIELFDDKAPLTVNNFVFLARQGFYDGVSFHRVIPGFMAQAGDPTGTGGGGPGYTFGDEFDPSLRHDGPGTVSMANRGPATNGSQFFVTYAPQPHLDDLHTVFGRVTEGLAVVESLAPRDPSTAGSTPGDLMLSVQIIEK